MKQEKDILKDCQELKNMPFSVPEGYFETAKDSLRKPVVRAPGFLRRAVPYFAMAATFAIMVSVGTHFLEKTTYENFEMTEEDYILFSANMMNSISYEMEYGSQLAEAELSEEDLINYLIYIGVTPEEIEFAK